MAKRKGSIYGATVVYERTFGGTSIGRRPKFSSMNKNKKEIGRNIEDKVDDSKR